LCENNLAQFRLILEEINDWRRVRGALEDAVLSSMAAGDDWVELAARFAILFPNGLCD